jgi:hypothetical protein
MYSFTRSLSQRYVSSSPPPNRTGGFHRIRLSPFGQSPWIAMKRLFPFRQLHGTFSVFSLRYAGYLCSRLPKG